MPAATPAKTPLAPRLRAALGAPLPDGLAPLPVGDGAPVAELSTLESEDCTALNELVPAATELTTEESDATAEDALSTIDEVL